MARGYPDFSFTGAGVYLMPEWKAKEGYDKDFEAEDATLSFGQEVYDTYTVPVGKTLYITQIGFALIPNVVANSEKEHWCLAQIYNPNTAERIWIQGGNGGGWASFTKPIVIKAGTTIWFVLIAYPDHTCTGFIYAGGYEI